MYSIDGVALANPTYGWQLKRNSEPWISRGLDRPDFNASNRDGTVTVRGHVTTPALTLVVRAPDSSVEALRRLLRMGTSVTKTGTPGIALNVQIVTLTHQTVRVAGGGMHELTAVYRVAPDVWWRDVATTDWSSTIPASTSAGAANMSVLTATTGHVTDAMIVLQGTITKPRLTGMNGTWMEYSSHLTNRWVRFEAARGRLFFGTIGDGLDVWSDTTNDFTYVVNTGAYPYFLELAPASTGPAACTLGLSWDSCDVATSVTVRARNAYDR